MNTMRSVIKTLVISSMVWIAIVNTYAQKIGLLMDSYVIERWYMDQKLFTDKVKELGGECIVEVPYGDPVEQVKLGKKLIQEGVDVLVIIPTDSKMAAEIVAAAKDANIPVISYDRLILSRDISFYVSYNNFKVGELQAEYALKRVPKGKYVLLNGPTTDNNAILFRKGQLEMLKPYVDKGDISIIGDIVLNDWSEIEALMKMDEFLSKSEHKPDAILAANDALASGTIQILPADLQRKIVVTGQDAELAAMKHIIAGNQSMTIYKSIRQIAYTAAEVAMALAKGSPVPNKTTLKNGDFEVDAILLEPIVVDKSNYKDTVVKDGHVSLSEIVGKK